MAEIKGLFPRAPSVYGRVYQNEKDLILDLVHNTFKRCYFKECSIIIADTDKTTLDGSLIECQFDDCEITIIRRAILASAENEGRPDAQALLTPIATHIDVMATPARGKNLITSRLDNGLMEKLGQKRSIAVLKQLASRGELFSFRFRDAPQSV